MENLEIRKQINEIVQKCEQLVSVTIVADFTEYDGDYELIFDFGNIVFEYNFVNEENVIEKLLNYKKVLSLLELYTDKEVDYILTYYQNNISGDLELLNESDIKTIESKYVGESDMDFEYNYILNLLDLQPDQLDFMWYYFDKDLFYEDNFEEIGDYIYKK